MTYRPSQVQDLWHKFVQPFLNYLDPPLVVPKQFWPSKSVCGIACIIPGFPQQVAIGFEQGSRCLGASTAIHDDRGLPGGMCVFKEEV